MPFDKSDIGYSDNNKRRVRFFSSFQEQENEMIAYWASVTPVRRLQHLHELILHSYGIKEGQKRTGSNSIVITRNEP